MKIQKDTWILLSCFIMVQLIEILQVKGICCASNSDHDRMR